MNAASPPSPKTPFNDPLAWIDALSILAVLTLAGLIGSSIVRETEVWRHLATGRAVAATASPGLEPFRSDAIGTPWVNTNWLYDLGLYAAHSFGGDAALVWSKAVAAILFAFGLWLATGPDRLGWWAISLVGLGVIASAPRFAAQLPALASFVLAAWLIAWIRLTSGPTRTIGIAVLVAIWSNVDAWFILGPAIVALLAVGSLLVPGSPPLRTSAVDVGVSLAAGCVNPFLWNGYGVPPNEWVALSLPADVRNHPLLQAYIYRTTGPTYWQSAGPMPVYALSILFLASLGSFAPAGRSGLRWLPLWIGFAGLAVLARSVPFFVAVAVVTTAANTRSILDRFPNCRWDAGATTGRIAALLVFAGLIWVWPASGERAVNHRQIGWVVATDPAQQRLAQLIAQAYADKHLSPEDSVVYLNPELAHYVVWASPVARVNIDARLHVYRDYWADFLKARSAFDLLAEKQSVPADVQAWLPGWIDQQKAACVAIAGRSDKETLGGIVAFHADADRWRLWALSGRNAAFVRSGRTGPPPYDLVAAAFRDVGPIRFGIADPAKKPSRWDFTLPPAEPFDEAESKVWMEMYEHGVARRWFADRAASVWTIGAWPGLYAAMASGGTVFDPRLFLEDARSRIEPAKFLRIPLTPGDDLIAMPLLALRAARRATFARPDLPGPYLSLARAARAFATNATIQRLNLLTAMRKAIDRRDAVGPGGADPALVAQSGYAALAELFGRDQIDQKLAAMQESVRLFPRVYKDVLRPEVFQKEIKALEEELGKLEEFVNKLRDEFESKSQGIPPPEKVQLATSLGLTDEALKILSDFPEETLGPGGGYEKANLLLRSGRADEARKLLLSQYFNPVTVLPADRQQTFRFLHLQAAAAVGDYDRAREELTASLAELAKSREALQREPLGLLAGLMLNPDPHPLGRVIPPKPNMWLEVVAQFQSARISQVDLHLWRGLLALEEGDLPAARRHLGLAVSSAGPNVQFDARQAVERYLILLSPK